MTGPEVVGTMFRLARTDRWERPLVARKTSANQDRRLAGTRPGHVAERYARGTIPKAAANHWEGAGRKAAACREKPTDMDRRAQILNSKYDP
jgi:hypothetical protein